VLMGVQVPGGERPDFLHLLDGLGYWYRLETENPACRIFAGAVE
jgi:threonine dehydratase